MIKILTTAFAATALLAMASIAPAMAAGDAAAGEKLTKRCAACHTFNEGGKNRMGPNLFGVFGRDIASADGYKRYSKGLLAIEGNWDEEKLDEFLTNPSNFVTGRSKMGLRLRKQADRDNVIEYLKTLQPPEPAAAPN